MRRRQPLEVTTDVESRMPAHLRTWTPEMWDSPDPDRTVCGRMWHSHRRWQAARFEWAKTAGVDRHDMSVRIRDMVRDVSLASLERGGRSFFDDLEQR